MELENWLIHRKSYLEKIPDSYFYENDCLNLGNLFIFEVFSKNIERLIDIASDIEKDTVLYFLKPS